MNELKDFTASTVLLGRFNPLIFSPEWLSQHNIVGPTEANGARDGGIEVMAPNITSVVIGSMKLIVEEGRFFLTVQDAPLIRAKDFPVGCFRLLQHTPVSACGINFTATVCGDSAESWHRFGDLLAPKAPWGSFVTEDDGQRTGGMRAIVMEKSNAHDGHPGYVRCSIHIAENIDRTAEIQVNNHFDLSSLSGTADGGAAYELIEERWDDLLTQGKLLFAHIKELLDGA